MRCFTLSADFKLRDSGMWVGAYGRPTIPCALILQNGSILSSGKMKRGGMTTRQLHSHCTRLLQGFEKTLHTANDHYSGHSVCISVHAFVVFLKISLLSKTT